MKKNLVLFALMALIVSTGLFGQQKRNFTKNAVKLKSHVRYEYAQIVYYSGNDAQSKDPGKNGPVFLDESKTGKATANTPSYKANVKNGRRFPICSGSPAVTAVSPSETFSPGFNQQGVSVKIVTASSQTVEILLRTYGISIKNRLLIIQPNSEVAIRVDSSGKFTDDEKKTGIILLSGEIWEDKDAKDADTFERTMEFYDSAVIHGTIEKIVKDMRVKTPDKNKLAAQVINAFAAGSGAFSALTSMTPTWMLPAEFAFDWYKNVMKANLAYALACVYQTGVLNVKDDLYVLFIDDDVVTTVKSIAEAAAKAAGVTIPKDALGKIEGSIDYALELLQDEDIVGKALSSKTVQNALAKAATSNCGAKLTKKLTVSNVTKGAKVLSLVKGMVMDAKDMKKFGNKAAQYYNNAVKNGKYTPVTL